MASTGFFLLSHEVGMHEQKGKWKHMKCIFGRRQSCSMFSSLSSRSTRQDIWSIEVSNSIWRQMNYSPCKCKIYIFKSFLMPDPISRIPPLKDIASFLTRSYNTLHEIPLLLQLAPAVGIIAFTVWGLRPLMRYSQNLFLHWNGNNSKKPESNYILSFYLHPLLLWIGATLICRALDPVILPSAASQGVKQRLLNFVKSLSTVLAFAYCLSSLIQQAQKFFMDAHDSTDTRNMGFQFAAKAVYTAVWVAAVSLFMELLGFSTQKWITAGGLGTLILTLAGREIFTNFLSSIMIHATRPFVLNEWIQTKIEGYEVSGTVEHVGWWSPTVIRGDDREAVHIPNHKFTVTVVRNLSQKTHWRIKTHLAISHLDVSKVNNIVADMRKVLAKNPQIEQQRLHRRVFLDNIDLENQALLIMISCFVKTSRFEEYLGVKEQVLLDLLRVIRHHRARLATPIRTIQRTSSDPDIENASFSDTIFTRARAATDRQFLLIEPPYKINGEDRMKTRPIRTGDEQVIKKSEMSDSRLATSEPNDVSGPVLDESEKRFKKEDSGGNVEIKNDNEKMSSASSPLTRPSLEDNIVLGVALDGSKRTLPIEEDDMSPSPPVESKDLTTCLNGSNIGGSQVSTKEKDGEMNTALGTVHSNSDQRDQER